VERIEAEGPLARVSALRTFEPGDRVAARLEITSGGVLRRSAAGLDLMGDGRLVAFAGAVGRRPLEPCDGETPYDAVRRELSD
jgi:hypothetical protein